MVKHERNGERWQRLDLPITLLARAILSAKPSSTQALVHSIGVTRASRGVGAAVTLHTLASRATESRIADTSVAAAVAVDASDALNACICRWHLAVGATPSTAADTRGFVVGKAGVVETEIVKEALARAVVVDAVVGDFQVFVDIGALCWVERERKE